MRAGSQPLLSRDYARWACPQGRVTLVGAGPATRNLLTAARRQGAARARLVLYDNLVGRRCCATSRKTPT